MATKTRPTTQGQICIITNPLPDENPVETYIITEDLSECSDDKITYVVSITDLQRNIATPNLAPRKAIKISELSVVAKDITSYVNSWNEQ